MQFPFLMYKRRLAPSVGVAVPYMNDHSVAVRFLEAVQINPDDAWAFVSKICAQSLDLEALREILSADVLCKPVMTAAYINDTKNSLTRSVYIEDPARNMRRLLHLRMVKEPDQYGLWKVYGVEQEECLKLF